MPTPARTGYTFKGWYTAATGGSKVESGTKVTITANQTLYAQWVITYYSVSYRLNGGSGKDWSASCPYGEVYMSSEKIPVREGYEFIGWARNADSGSAEYMPGDLYSESKDIVLYAVWKALPSTETSIVKKSGYSLLNVEVKNAEPGVTVVTAAYKNGRLADVQSEVFCGKNISFAVTKEFDTLKTMLWDSLSGFRPIAKAEIKYLEK